MRKRETKKVTPERLQQFGFAYAPPLIISAAVNNKVFDTLQGGPKTVEQLKKETGSFARGLRAIMDALVGLELLKKDRQSRYSLTPESQAFLISEKPGTLAGFFGSILPVMTSRWLRLTDIVRDGRPAVAVNQETEGTEFFSQLVETIIPMSYPGAQKLADHFKIAKTKAVGASNRKTGAASFHFGPRKTKIMSLAKRPHANVMGTVSDRTSE